LKTARNRFLRRLWWRSRLYRSSIALAQHFSRTFFLFLFYLFIISLTEKSVGYVNKSSSLTTTHIGRESTAVEAADGVAARTGGNV
jgi:hypothetical protein